MRVILASICLALTLASCGVAGSTTPSPSLASSPSPGTELCPKLASQATVISGYVLDMAALLSATITVSNKLAAQPTCAVLTSGQTVSLDIGDRVELTANQPPMLTPDPNPVLAESDTPGASGTGPGGGVPTSHVTVTLTAKGPGTVTLHWVDCSGTAC